MSFFRTHEVSQNRIGKMLCYFAVTLCYTILTACKSDKPSPIIENRSVVLPDGSSNVLVINEGNFQFENASLTFVNGKTFEFSSDAFNASNGRKLGDVAQSAVVWNGRLYVVVNNSQKIEVLDAHSFRSMATVSGFVSPRYILPISYSKAYVTDLYANSISVLNLNTFIVEKKIPCAGWTERMLYHMGKVYVTNYWAPYLYVIDPTTDTKTDSIYIGKGAQSIVADKWDRIVVACGGYKTPNTDTRLVFINVYNKKIEKAVQTGMNFPASLAVNSTKDTLYFLLSAIGGGTEKYSSVGVCKLSIEANEITAPFIVGNARNLYGLGLDVKSNRLYVSDAVDNIQVGKVYLYSPSGQELGRFDAGINPGNFCFY
jgi:YVTN family beta-propeller protein